MPITVTDEKSFEEAVKLAERRRIDLLNLKLRVFQGEQVPERDITLSIRYAVQSIMDLCHELGKGREDLYKLKEELLGLIEMITNEALVLARRRETLWNRLFNR